jgi:hypothetical protein
MNNRITVKRGIKIAVRHPEKGAEIIAKTLADTLIGEDWITDEFKLKFCIMFVDNLIDGNIEKSIDRKLLEKVKDRTFIEGIRLMKHRPRQGMKFMVAIIMDELRNHQGFSEKEQFIFYENLLQSFFPELKVSDFIS